MIVGGYSLDLYCDYGDKDKGLLHYHRYNGGTAHFDAFSRVEAHRMAREEGWKLEGDKCYCPKHAKSPELTTGENS